MMDTQILVQENGTEIQKCQICETPSSKSCLDCSEAFYCSSEHQLLHRKVHKSVCKGYALRYIDDDHVGRHVATRNSLNAGDLIFQEIPVVSAPFATPQLGKASVIEVRCCIGCNQLLEKHTAQECSKCQLPVCSSACEELPLHAHNECEIFQKYEGKYRNISSQDILILRTCLLKKKDSCAWEAITSMQPSPGKTGKAIKMSKSVVQQMLGTDFITPDEWTLIVDVLNTRSTDMAKSFTLPNGSQYTSSWRFLCPETTVFVPSCAPNCHFDCTPAPNMQMIIRTAKDVKKDKILTIDHQNGKNWFMGTYMRRRLDVRTTCQCIRCKDPSELGSNLSTFVCRKCKSPTMMSTDPLDETADWKCEKCEAVDKGSSSKISVMDKICKTVDEVNLNEVGKKSLLTLISQYSGKTLHRNNWVLAKAHLKLVEFLSARKLESYDNKDDDDVCISSAKHLISIANLIEPGITLYKSNLLQHLASALLRKALKDRANMMISLKEFWKQLEKIMGHYIEANKYFQTFPDTSNGCISSAAIHLERELEKVKLMHKDPPPPGTLLEDDEFEHFYGNQKGQRIRRRLLTLTRYDRFIE